jgi:alpha-tubulin suppressor-like RCC1 family protein
MKRSRWVIAVALAVVASVGVSSTPTRAAGVIEIAAGNSHTCAITAEGGVDCWGENVTGEVGDGTSANFRRAPVAVSGLPERATAISLGIGVSCALIESGGVMCWGWNTWGVLGDGTQTNRSTPVQVVGLQSGITAISAGDAHVCAITTERELKCWGRNYAGQLGNGQGGGMYDLSTTPVDVCADASCSARLSDVVAVSAGGLHTCALLASGDLKCWGGNGSGQLGDGTTVEEHTPIDIVGLPASPVASVSAGKYDTCAVLQDGAARCWGAEHAAPPTSDEFGHCGPHNSPCSPVPIEVPGLDGNVASIIAGGFHTCALSTSGGVQCWGENSQGQLGDGTFAFRATAAGVAGLTTGAMSIAVGESHTCALTRTRGALCWGNDFAGQVGGGDVCGRRCLHPTSVRGLGAKAVGNTNCTGAVDSVDSALVLQYSAALISTLACPDYADTNGDGHVTSVDAALILQYVAGLLQNLAA